MKNYFVLVFLLLTIGCSTNREAPPHYNRPATTGTTQNGVTTDDFALDVVLGKAKTVESIPDLEDWINKSDGVTRVDLDVDGNLDFIQIQVTQEGDDQVLSFYAWPNDEKRFPEGVPIAEGRIKHQGDQVVVSGGYTPAVAGYGAVSYSYASPMSSFAAGYLMARMFSPGYMYTPIYGGYGGYRNYVHGLGGYGARGVPPRSSFRDSRTSVTTRVTKTAGPIKTAKSNSGFVPSKKTQAVANKYKARAPKTKSGVTDFKRRSSTRTNPRVGGKNAKRSAPPARRTTPKRDTTRRAPTKRSPSRSFRSPSRSGTSQRR